jgi:hypothetical protein
MQEASFDSTLIDWQALDQLAMILGWENSEKVKFTYPPFIRGYFARGVSKLDFNQAMQPKHKLGQPVSSPQDAREIAAKIFNLKKPIHFRLYQEKAVGWNLISIRRP